MEQGLQKANHYNRLAEWVQRVEACRRNGQKVSEWYTEQGILVSTYYSWQRKVFQMVTAEPEVCFTEISARPAGRGTAASIESGELRIEIYAGADAEAVRAIITEYDDTITRKFIEQIVVVDAETIQVKIKDADVVITRKLS